MMLRANVLAKIEEDHAKIRSLIKQILEPSISDKKRKDLYGDFRRELTLHTMLEDESLYGLLKTNGPTTAWARIACVQHATQDRLIGRLDKLTVQNPDFMKILRELTQEVLGHMKNEEEELAEITKQIPILTKPPTRPGRRPASAAANALLGMTWNASVIARPGSRG